MALFGRRDETLRLVEKELGVTISSRGDDVAIDGDPVKVARARQVLTELLEIVRAGHRLTTGDIRYAIDMVREGSGTSLVDVMSDVVQVTTRGKRICPKTLGQKRYIEAMRRSGIVFAIGPAGTGKTYLAMAMAIAALKNKEISRIVLTRPVVEAGEKLGFLPGDLQEKVDPYLRPLYDAIYDIVGVDTFRKHMERGIIEIAPLAYMRGRTLDDSFIILDEAQNTTHEQMKMFLTRMGFGSRVVVTGDLTQIDLPSRKFSGLEEVQYILRGVEGVEFVYLTDRDVVRNELVQKVIRAYERYEHEKGEA
ncbi:MAG: PhoH family protein [Bacillota bacterium]|nr:PhoH family protein [Bacillota bacterium]MDI6637595.1 PhoH family protein [Bacillota bacterium]